MATAPVKERPNLCLLATADPLIGEARSLARYMIHTAPKVRRVFTLTSLGRTISFLSDVMMDPSDSIRLKFSSPGRWTMTIGLMMNRDTYRHQMTDHRGATQVVETDMMSMMPGYFAEYAHLRHRKRFNQNSEEMAIFYVLRYGEVFTAELVGSKDVLPMFQEDMTMFKMTYGEEMLSLEK